MTLVVSVVSGGGGAYVVGGGGGTYVVSGGMTGVVVGLVITLVMYEVVDVVTGQVVV